MSEREKAKEFLMKNHAFIERLDEHLVMIEKQIKSVSSAENPSVEDLKELKNQYELHASQRQQLIETREKLLVVLQELEA